MQEHLKQIGAEADALSSLPPLGEGPLNAIEYKQKCQLVASHFEKRIKKTRKVAEQTDESLKKQKEQLTTLKDKFIEHIEKLKIAAPNESGTSQKKKKDMEVKLTQIGKILPYLEKYMQANKQAELQTLAILKEGCTMKLQQLESRYKQRSNSISSQSPSTHGKLDRRMSMPANIGSTHSSKAKKTRSNSTKSTTSTNTKEGEQKQEQSLPLVADSSIVSSITPPSTAPPMSQHQTPGIVEEPAYATVGHLKHTREPSLPEHYVKLQLNQNIGQDGNNSRQIQPQQEIGVHYSIVQVNPKKDSLKHMIAPMMPVDESMDSDAQDRGGVVDTRDKDTAIAELESVGGGRDISPHSPIPFTSSPGLEEDYDHDLLNTTSSETSLGLLDTVVEEETNIPLIVTDTTTTNPSSITPSPSTPVNTSPIHEVDSSHSPINLSPQPPPVVSSSPILSTSISATPPAPIPDPPVSPPTLPTKLTSITTSPVPIPPSVSPTPPSNSSSMLTTPPCPTPPSVSPTPSQTIPESSKDNGLPLKTSNKFVNESSSVSGKNAIDAKIPSPIKRPPPPPVMKKTKSPHNKQSPPTIPKKTARSTPPPPPSGVLQTMASSSVTISPTPPPVKAKPKRNRSSNSSGIPDDRGSDSTTSNNNNNDILSQSLTSVAQRRKVS